MQKSTKIKVASSLVVALAVLVLALVLTNPITAWWVSAPIAQFTSDEPFHIEFFGVSEDNGAPGKTQVFSWRVQNLQPDVTYGVRYFAYPWFNWGVGKGSPVESTVKEVEFFIDPSKSNEDGSITLTLADGTITPVIEGQTSPSAKVWLFLDGVPYIPGEKVNIGPGIVQILDIRIRPGAETPPGQWFIAPSIDRGEPIIITGKG